MPVLQLNSTMAVVKPFSRSVNLHCLPVTDTYHFTLRPESRLLLEFDAAFTYLIHVVALVSFQASIWLVFNFIYVNLFY